jgi:hypothetical protein
VTGLTDELFCTNTVPVRCTSHEAYETVDAADADNADAIDTNPADVTDSNASDAEAFQLPRGDDTLMATITGEIAVDQPADLSEGLAEQSIEFQSHFSDSSTLVVDHFPFGEPGAPLPAMREGRSSFQARDEDSNWAPF